MTTKTTKNLELNFATAAGKSKKITLRHAKSDVTAEVAGQAMKAIVDKDIFKKDDVDQFAKAKSANYVTRTVEEVYTASEAA